MTIRAFDCDHPGPPDRPCAVCGIGPEEWPEDEAEADIRAIEREAATPSVEALAVLDNLLRHHNTLHSSDCEFARAALARLSPPTDTERCIFVGCTITDPHNHGGNAGTDTEWSDEQRD